MVKALFPIGKTQWAKWRPEQQIVFNETRAVGISFAEAVDYVNRLELIEVNIAPKKKKKKNIFDRIEDVAEAVAQVAEVAAMVSPVVSIVSTVVKATKKKVK